MDGAVGVPRLKQSLTPKRDLALVGQEHSLLPCHDDLLRIIQPYSTNRDFAPYDLTEELQNRGLFQVIGDTTTRPIPFRQSIEDYVESFHARNGFSRERMTEGDAQAFDNEVAARVSRFRPDGAVDFQVSGRVIVGHPG